MIAQLSELSQTAQPTAFHHLLRALDDRGRLLRVYTQNIDAIEQKSGLSFGVPAFEGTKRAKSKTSKATAPPQQPIASTSRLPTPPPLETPRCIPLHGTLQSMHCQTCNHSFPLLAHHPALRSGQPPPCPECTSVSAVRALVGKRPRGIGKLRPSVVLYNEAHKDGEGVGEVVRKDLIGTKGRASGADLLLVVGTSLRVPGTKRMVREFAKAVKVRGGVSKEDVSPPRSAPSTPGSSSPRRSPAADEEPLPKAVYLNLDFPVPTREWEGVFDAWIQGDAQEFAAVLRAEIEKEARAKEVASERKRKRDEAAAAANELDEEDDEMPDLLRDRGRKWGNQEKESPTKRRLATADLLASPTPPSTKKRKVAVVIPPSSRREAESVDEDDKFHSSPKLTVRIPPPHSRPSPYYVPEVYITSKAPQYLRRYGMMMMNSKMPGIEQHVDIEIEDLDVGVRRMDVEDDDATLSSSSSSSPIASDSSLSESPSSSPASSPPSSHKLPVFGLHERRLPASISRSVSPSPSFRDTDRKALPQGTCSHSKGDGVEDDQVKRHVSTKPVQKIHF
jgi:NAD-dependent SIR2 family protein deacetylase